MLAMVAHGVASCPQTSLGFHPRIVREALGAGATQRLLFGISFGYKDAGARRAAAICASSRLSTLLDAFSGKLSHHSTWRGTL